MQVVTPIVFEIHAGSRNKRPIDYIFMENGNTFRDLLNACIQSKYEDLEATVRSVCGRPVPEENSLYGVNCSGTTYFDGNLSNWVCVLCCVLRFLTLCYMLSL